MGKVVLQTPETHTPTEAVAPTITHSSAAEQEPKMPTPTTAAASDKNKTTTFLLYSSLT
jgi:hypothetical protein